MIEKYISKRKTIKMAYELIETRKKVPFKYLLKYLYRYRYVILYKNTPKIHITMLEIDKEEKRKFFTYCYNILLEKFKKDKNITFEVGLTTYPIKSPYAIINYY